MLDTWLETIRDTFVALNITTADPDRFAGSVRARRLAHLMAATIRIRRLEMCRQAMLSPANAHRPLTDLATGTGFTDLATFSRAFTAAYGTTPSRYREQHSH
jgi:AraC-like DNA-binding protein